MKDYTNKIEKYLRGQMSHDEEEYFKNNVRSKKRIRSQAYLTIMLMRAFGMGT